MTIRDKDRGFRQGSEGSARCRAETAGGHGRHSRGGRWASTQAAEAEETDQGEHAQALTIGAIAEKNEFGRGVRARSFVVAYAEAAKADIEAQERNLARGVAKGKIGRKQYGELFGLFAVGGMQKRISDGIPPPNEKSTILRKGSSVPLIDTGQLRSSIRHKVKQ